MCVLRVLPYYTIDILYTVLYCAVHHHTTTITITTTITTTSTTATTTTIQSCYSIKKCWKSPTLELIYKIKKRT